MDASSFLQSSDAGLLTPDSNPTAFNVCVHSRSHAAAVTRAVRGSLQPPDNIQLFVRCQRRFDIQLSQHFATQVCLFHASETLLQWSTISRYSLGHRNLTASRSVVDAKKFALSSSVLFAFLHLLRHQLETDFWCSPVSLFVSTHLVLITL